MTEEFSWIHSTAVSGDGRGTALGFPTANLILEPGQVTPDEGIWACWANIEDEDLTVQAVLHVGPRPTFENATPSIELHFLHFPPRDLYGQSLRFKCVEKIRDIKKFSSTEDLVEAMTADCLEAERILTDSAYTAL